MSVEDANLKRLISRRLSFVEWLMDIEATCNDGFDIIGVYLIFFIESADNLQFHTFAVSNITITALFNITKTFKSNKRHPCKIIA